MAEPLRSWNRGERNPKAKLRWADVLEIRSLVAMGRRDREIAAAFGVTAGTIGDIRLGRRWAKGPGEDTHAGAARRHRAAKRRLRRERRAAGLCATCGEPNEEPALASCPPCRAYDKLRRGT